MKYKKMLQLLLIVNFEKYTDLTYGLVFIRLYIKLGNINNNNLFNYFTIKNSLVPILQNKFNKNQSDVMK